MQPQGVRPERAVTGQGKSGFDPLVGQHFEGFDGDARLVKEQTTGIAKARAGEDDFDLGAALAAARGKLVDLGYGRRGDRCAEHDDGR